MSAAIPRHRKILFTVLFLTFWKLVFAGNHVSFLMFLGHCIRGDMGAIQAILKENPEYAFELSTEGESCLHLAGVYGHVEITRLLLQDDVDAHKPKSHETEPAKENNSHPRNGRVSGEHGDTVGLALLHRADSTELSRFSELDTLVEDIRDGPIHADSLESETFSGMDGAKRVDEL